MKHALLFSPQGSQAPGMGRELAERSPAARAVYDEADSILGWSVSDLCWNGPAERLDDTRQTQPCLLATSVAALRALSEAGAHAPVIVAGHSVGEYAAQVAAGVLDLGAALRLVSQRAELMASADDGTGGMAAVIGLDRERVEIAVDRVARPTELVVANDNAPGQVVISGRRDLLRTVEPVLLADGARRFIRLPVSGAFHSPFMAGVAEQLADAFETEAWHDATIPVVSNVTAEPLTDAGRIRALLAEQVRSPVRWVECVEAMVAENVEVMIECGAGAALAGMVRRIAPAVRTGTVTDGATLDAAIAMLAARTVEASA
jgi:[acyl-carrier-protein] S-malonyltransferase